MTRFARAGYGETLFEWRGQLLPIASTVAASALTIVPWVAMSPLMPPLGLMMALAWRLLRPGLWPAWIAIPLGIANDIFGGDPFGTSLALWTMVFIALDGIDRRLIWRGYREDWLIASLAILFCLAGGLLAANIGGGKGDLVDIVPQLLLSCGLFPAMLRCCAALDRWRLGQ